MIIADGFGVLKQTNERSKNQYIQISVVDHGIGLSD